MPRPHSHDFADALGADAAPRLTVRDRTLWRDHAADVVPVLDLDLTWRARADALEDVSLPTDGSRAGWGLALVAAGSVAFWGSVLWWLA